MESKKKQFCGYCPIDKCLLDCIICNPKEKSGELTTKIDHEGTTYHFCSCPHCEDQFRCWNCKD